MTFLAAEKSVLLRTSQLSARGRSRPLVSSISESSDVFDSLDDSRQPESVAAVLKVFGIMQALSEQSVIGISDISQRLAMPKATVYRFLQTMKSLGYVQQEQESERYGLTMRVFELGCKALEFPDLLQIADRQMRQLSLSCMETLHLAALVDHRAVYIHKINSPRMLGLNTHIGKQIPLHCTAAGKVLLAFSQAAIRENIIGEMEFAALQPATLADAGSLNSALDRVLEQGFAEDIQEYDADICCLAVPVLDYLNNVVAGLSMTFPVIRYNSSQKEVNISMLHRTAREISRQLGCTDYPF